MQISAGPDLRFRSVVRDVSGEDFRYVLQICRTAPNSVTADIVFGTGGDSGGDAIADARGDAYVTVRS